MGDGVAMFDETPRLVAWNHRFQEILDVPEAVMQQRPTFEAYIRYLTERGEFGPDADPDEQVRRLLAMRGHSAVFERTRPDGRVIEVRQNPVPGGGFVLIYADITERKRNEAALRAARDASDRALRDLQAAQASLVQAEKMASLGQLTAGIAHEIKNPLNFVNNFSELSVDLLDELHDAIDANRKAEIDELSATLRGNLEKIVEHGKRADSIVKNMLLHSRSGPSERRAIELNAAVEEALNLAYHGARAETPGFNITLVKELDQRAGTVELYPQEFTRVMVNLINNGFYAARKRADVRNDVEPALALTTRDLGEQVEIRVRDNGTGIGAAVRDRIFEPFFTTKPAGEGTGLGLSLSYDIIVKQHGGRLTVDSRIGEYTEFLITLPRAMAANDGGRA
jgi:signal transduction histidine kinase